MNLVDVNTKFEMRIEKIGTDMLRITMDGLDYKGDEFMEIRKGEICTLKFEIDKENVVPVNWDEIEYPKSKPGPKPRHWWWCGLK